MISLTDALADLDEAERKIGKIHPKEVRDAMLRYAGAQRQLIKALSQFDRAQLEPSRQKPTLVVVK